MTPMIDVTFLLIIFFLVSSHLAKQENRMKLDLPVASTALDEDNERRTLTIQVSADGTWQLGTSGIMTISKLVSTLAAKNREVEGGVSVRIRTDKTVAYSQIAPLLKACTQAGATDVVFAVFDSKQVSRR